MLENGTKVKHKTEGYNGLIEDTTKITGFLSYRVRLVDNSIRLATEAELDIIGDAERFAPPVERSFVFDCIRKYKLSYLIHATHKDNLVQILQTGLLSRDMLIENKTVYHSLANESVQEIREDKQVYLFGSIKKGIHACVPLYISWRTPTIYAFIKETSPYDIIHILVDTLKILTKEGYAYCFTDGNAASDKTNHYWALKNLENLDWQSIKGDYWIEDQEKTRIKNAEFLIYPKIDVSDFYKIVVVDDNIKKEVETLISTKGFNLKVEVDARYYTWPKLF